MLSLTANESVLWAWVTRFRPLGYWVEGLVYKPGINTGMSRFSYLKNESSCILIPFRTFDLIDTHRQGAIYQLLLLSTLKTKQWPKALVLSTLVRDLGRAHGRTLACSSPLLHPHQGGTRVDNTKVTAPKEVKGIRSSHPVSVHGPVIYRAFCFCSFEIGFPL